MGLNQASFYGDNLGSPDTGHQYGPFNLGTCKKLLHVVASLTTSYQGDALSNTAVLNFGIVWGVQWVPHGNSPLALPADAFEANFLWAEYAIKDTGVNVAWTPDTSPGAYIALTSVEEQWRGQYPIGQNIDLYLTTAYAISSSQDFYGSFIMRVTNST